MSRLLTACTAIVLALAAPAQCRENFFGAHLLVDSLDARGKAQFSWARHLVGKGGYVKTLFGDISRATTGASQSRKDFVAECYRQDLIPVIRLAGHYSGEKSYWIKPEMDADGSYTGIAEAVKRVVRDLPRSDRYPLYIEVWNEPNLDLEWTGKANLKEYAKFFVAVSRAIRSIGDPRIKILNGAFALSAESTEECIKAEPDFINAFDVWASHPYPQNHPPDYNMHDGTAKYPEASIDGYLLEMRVLEKYGRKNVRVMITETGWVLGNAPYEFEGYPVVNQANRANYALRAFRDFYPRWPEVIAVFPFLFSDPGWRPFNWVDPDISTDENGLPKSATPQYWMVKALAQPLDETGCISGNVTDSSYGGPLEGALVEIRETGQKTTTNATGDYIFEALKPWSYTFAVHAEGFNARTLSAQVKAGENAVADARVEAARKSELAGVVVDGMGGEVLADVSVSLHPSGRKAQTDSSGRFVFSDLPPVPFVITAARKGYTSHELPVPPEAATGGLTLRIAADRAPAVKNMASNPSFEKVADPNARPLASLTWEPLVQGRWEVTAEFARSGKYSERLDATPGSATALRQITGYGTMTPGKTYVASVWARCRDIVPEPGGGAYFAMPFTKDSGEVIEDHVSPVKLSGTTGWQYLEVREVAPAGARRLSLNLWINAKSGSAFFDDAFMGLVE